MISDHYKDHCRQESLVILSSGLYCNFERVAMLCSNGDLLDIMVTDYNHVLASFSWHKDLRPWRQLNFIIIQQRNYK